MDDILLDNPTKSPIPPNNVFLKTWTLDAIIVAFNVHSAFLGYLQSYMDRLMYPLLLENLFAWAKLQQVT
jgi:hypothetical protein